MFCKAARQPDGYLPAPIGPCTWKRFALSISPVKRSSLAHFAIKVCVTKDLEGLRIKDDRVRVNLAAFTNSEGQELGRRRLVGSYCKMCFCKSDRPIGLDHIAVKSRALKF
jgi:hypothetical protein